MSIMQANHSDHDPLEALLAERRQLTAVLSASPDWMERAAYRAAYLTSEDYINFKLADVKVKGMPEYIRRREVEAEIKAIRKMDQDE